MLLEVATPDRLLIKEDVLQVEVPAADGVLGILPDHAPLVSALGSGALAYTTQAGGQRRFVAISGGWVEVVNNRVRVLADKAELGEEIDTKRAEEALRRASERLNHPTAELDVARAINAMKRAQARIAVANLAGSPISKH